LQLGRIVGKRAAGSLDAGSQTLWQSHFNISLKNLIT
jgi:hypothetical protein